MPRLDPKQVQKELEQGRLRPLYYLYGPEGMKVRELERRIARVALGPEEERGTGDLFGGGGTLDGSSPEVTGPRVVEEASSPSLLGGLRWIVVREAQALREPEALAALFGEPAARDALTSVCVLIARELDGRRKFSRRLVEGAAVVHCEEVAERDREAWIDYLAKRRGLPLGPATRAEIGRLDPWSLDLADAELEKLALLGERDDEAAARDVAGERAASGADAFIGALFARDRAGALARVPEFAEDPDRALPLVGLLAWHLRNPESSRLGLGRWSVEDRARLTDRLHRLDWAMKARPVSGLGAWTELVIEFC